MARTKPRQLEELMDEMTMCDFEWLDKILDEGDKIDISHQQIHGEQHSTPSIPPCINPSKGLEG